MKSLLYYLLIALIGWKAYQHFTNDASTIETPTQAPTTALPDVLQVGSIQPKNEKPALQQASPSFVCDGRTHCSQMRSLAEAKFFIQNCPNTKMDGDNDGNPCERQLGF
jgi:hypothetical protein